MLASFSPHNFVRKVSIPSSMWVKAVKGKSQELVGLAFERAYLFLEALLWAFTTEKKKEEEEDEPEGILQVYKPNMPT